MARVESHQEDPVAQPGPSPEPPDTRGTAYTARLRRRGGVWWKRVLPVQAPYRWNLRRHRLGTTLDVGCGIGRNLVSLAPGSLGVDHNPTSVAQAKAHGLDAVTTDEWRTDPRRAPGSFDSLLFAHVLEHMSYAEAVALVREYLPCLRSGGRVLVICPQERGYATDETHVTFLDGAALESIARDAGLVPDPWRSFPLPRRAGRAFTYNEFTLVARVP